MPRFQQQPRPERLSINDLPIGQGPGELPRADEALLSKLRVMRQAPGDNVVNEPFAHTRVGADGNPREPFFVMWAIIKGTDGAAGRGFLYPAGVTVTWDALNFYITTPLNQSGYEIAILHA